MIARFRAWLDRSGPTPAAIPLEVALTAVLQARVAELEKQLSTEQLITAALDAEIKRLVRQNNVINLRADAAIAEATRVRSDAQFVTAARCECGGDTELHWRRRAAAAEEQAQRDRANAVRMADEIERLRLIADEAERVVHIAEQLERAQ